MSESYSPKPGDLCRILTDELGEARWVEHVAPCPERVPTGTVTDVRTGEVVRTS